MIEIAKNPIDDRLLLEIHQIVRSHRKRWGGVPGGWIQGRADKFEERLSDYVTWCDSEFGMTPTVEHLIRVAQRMEDTGLSTLARLQNKASRRDYRAYFKLSGFSERSIFARIKIKF